MPAPLSRVQHLLSKNDHPGERHEDEAERDLHAEGVLGLEGDQLRELMGIAPPPPAAETIPLPTNELR